MCELRTAPPCKKVQPNGLYRKVLVPGQLPKRIFIGIELYSKITFQTNPLGICLWYPVVDHRRFFMHRHPVSVVPGRWGTQAWGKALSRTMFMAWFDSRVRLTGQGGNDPNRPQVHEKDSGQVLTTDWLGVNITCR